MAAQATGAKPDEAAKYILEECEIYFLYRPLPGVERIKTADDVAE